MAEQAIIMAAGHSTRTYPLTVTRPKAMLKVANKTILEHNLDQLTGLVKEVIIIVGYKKEKIMALGESYQGLSLKYVEQKEPMGTAHAVQLAENHIKGRFLVLNGDDLYSKEDIEEITKEEWCLLAKEVENPSKFGVVKIKDERVETIIEKPKEKVGNLANVGVYSFNKQIFEEIHKLKKSERGEYELTDAIIAMAKKERIKYKKVKAYWISVSYPWDLLDVNEFLLKKITGQKIEGIIETGVTIKGAIIIGKGTVLKSGTYIEGPAIIGENCEIGPNCYIRAHTSIANNCKVGQAVEIKNSIIMDKTKVPHLTYLGDSILGEGINIGAGMVSSNLRHDNKNIKSSIKGELTDTGRRKLGVIMGDGVDVGIGTVFYPGTKIWPDRTTLPGEIVRTDIV